MKRKTKKIILALVVIGAVAAGGAAFTAANTVPDNVAGYGTSTVTGTVATAIQHNLSTDGTHILSTDMTLTGDMEHSTVMASFDPANLNTNGSVCTGTWTADPLHLGADTQQFGTTAEHCAYGTPALTETEADSFSVAVTHGTVAP